YFKDYHINNFHQLFKIGEVFIENVHQYENEEAVECCLDFYTELVSKTFIVLNRLMRCEIYKEDCKLTRGEKNYSLLEKYTALTIMGRTLISSQEIKTEPLKKFLTKLLEI